MSFLDGKFNVAICKVDMYGKNTGEKYEAELIGIVALMNVPYGVLKVGTSIEVKPVTDIFFKEASDGHERMVGATDTINNTGADGLSSEQDGRAEDSVRDSKASSNRAAQPTGRSGTAGVKRTSGKR